MKTVVLLLAACAWLSGCSSHSTQQVADYSSVHHIYVEHRLNDNHRIDELIAAELKSLGYDASSGPLTMMPEKGVDAIIAYQDRWAWDFKSYLIDLRLEMRAVFTDKPLATGSYHQASAYTKSPAEVVREIVAPLFVRKAVKP
jgi:hypothetical protein